MKTNKNIIKRYEFGAFFKYQDLYKELLNLLTKLPSKRIGLNGIFFQKNINENSIDLLKFKDLTKKHRYSNSHSQSNLFESIMGKINFKKNMSLKRNNSELKTYFPHLSSSKNKNNSFKTLISLKKIINKEFLNKSNSFNSIRSKKEIKYNFKVKNNIDNLCNTSKYFQKFFYDKNEYFKRLERSKIKKREKKFSSVNKLDEMEINKKNILRNFFKKLSKSESKLLFRKNQ